MKSRAYIMLTGAIFLASTLGEAVRLIFRIPVQVGTFTVPMWPSALGMVVTLSLCIWAFRLAKK